MRAQMFGVVLVGLILMGGNCSRARVESMNEMNAGVELAQMKRFNEAAESLEKAGAASLYRFICASSTPAFISFIDSTRAREQLPPMRIRPTKTTPNI